VIREVVERSKLYAISRSKSGNIKLTGDDLLHSARGMKAHLALMKGKVEATPTVQEAAGAAFAKLVEESVKTVVNDDGHDFTRKVEAIHERVLQ